MTAAAQARTWLLLLFWPFGALLYAVVRHRGKYLPNVVWLFTIFFGLTFVISNEEIDANRYRDKMLLLRDSDYTYTEMIGDIWTGDYGRGDYLQPTISYVVGSLTDNWHFLFAAFGLIFGYFYSRNLGLIIERGGGHIGLLALPALVMFAFLIPIWNINGFRFYCASMIFTFGLMHYYRSGGRRQWGGLLVALLASLVHASFLLPCALLLVYLLLPINRFVLLILFGLAVVFSSLEIGTLLEFAVQFLPETRETKMALRYTHPDYVKLREDANAGTAWFIQLNTNFARYGSLLVFAYLSFQWRRLQQLRIQHWFGYAALLFAFTSIIASVPSAGRYFIVAQYLMFASLFVFIQRNSSSYWARWFVLLILPMVVLNTLVAVRIGTEVMGWLLFVGNPIIALFFQPETAIYQLL